jgi:mono/diheme cytochrome c family protein
MRLGLVCLIAMLSWCSAAWGESGEMMFNEYCVGCHQVGGSGVPGEYPRLAGRADAIASDPRGRAFLAQLMLAGMGGTISVDGRKVLGIMPSFGNLSDNDLAAILNYVVNLQGREGVPFTSQTLKRARLGSTATPEQMAELRNRLAGAHIIP